jgi:hypothetical protein
MTEILQSVASASGPDEIQDGICSFGRFQWLAASMARIWTPLSVSSSGYWRRWAECIHGAASSSLQASMTLTRVSSVIPRLRASNLTFKSQMPANVSTGGSTLKQLFKPWLLSFARASIVLPALTCILAELCHYRTGL